MKKYYVVFFIPVILFCKDTNACFQESFINEKSITTFSTFYEECCCTEPGYSRKDIRWLDPHNRIIGPGIDSNVYTEEQGDCVSLHIPSSSKTLAGSYHCVTRYKGVEYLQTHNLDVYDPLYFFNTKSSQYLVHNTDSMIRCDAKGASPPRFKWTRGEDGQNEITNSLKYQITNGGVIINNVTNEDAGIYKCSASVITTGEELEIDIDVKVMTVPTIRYLGASPENIVVAGEPLAIECRAEGLPNPEYVWNKLIDTKAGQEGKRNATWHQDNNTIRFESIEVEDAGIYECYAHNFVGNSSKNIEIKVLVPPSIIGFTNKTVVEGTEIAMVCNATGIPTPNITIVYEGKSFEEEKNPTYERLINNYSLLKVDRSKEGIYVCNATNEVDYETEYMYLTVLHPPRFEDDYQTIWGWNGEAVHLKCEPDANPPPNINWRYTKDPVANVNESIINHKLNNEYRSLPAPFRLTDDFSPYGIYECIATNELGKTVMYIDLKKGYVPAPLQNVSLWEITATSVTFILDNNFNFTGPPLLGFKAEYDTAENYEITYIHHNRTWAQDRPLKLSGLKPNSTYKIRFAAINKVGTGEWGELIEFETLEKSAPEPPIWQVDPLEFTTGNVLKWKEPEDNGEPIDYYALRYCPVLEEIDESECKEERIEAVTERQLDDLEQNVTYYFEIVAHNSEGNSTAANISLYILPTADDLPEPSALLSNGAIIGISIVIVLLCLVLLDVLLLFWRQQGIIASCCYKKSKKKPNPLQSRDKKGLLKDNGENTDDTLRRPNNGHREYEYNKNTGIITGKHSSV